MPSVLHAEEAMVNETDLCVLSVLFWYTLVIKVLYFRFLQIA